MFKKFEDSNVSGLTQLKSSVQKGLRTKIVEEYSVLEDYIDEILPKKESIKIAKCHEHVEIMVNASGEHLFFKQRDGPFIPSLKLVHKYPFICPLMQVDKGAINFMLSGANCMAPGLTSKGGKMTPGLKAGQVVTIVAEGKQHALAVGVLKMSPEEILKVNKGIAIENVHYLNDGLWRLKPVK
ncbi:Malignant T-cell-amplified sequence 1 -like protein [Halotydeus destructor]|nr:Malignant T-cell-amplified sequence 1 -like protein [Halotydeus destructor]